MNAEELKTILDNHKKWIDTNGKEGGKANLRYTDLSHANLSYADLRYADLSYADWDFSCLPLWCGSLDMKVDKRISSQIAYHLCRFVCDDPEVKQAQNSIMALANQFHRVEECGKIKEKEL